MGFFKDFREDLSQSANYGPGEEIDDDQMVNTLDQEDPEDLTEYPIENIPLEVREDDREEKVSQKTSAFQEKEELPSDEESFLGNSEEMDDPMQMAEELMEEYEDVQEDVNTEEDTEEMMYDEEDLETGDGLDIDNLMDSNVDEDVLKQMLLDEPEELMEEDEEEEPEAAEEPEESKPAVAMPQDEESMKAAFENVTVITKGTRINGSIISDGSLEVMGTVSGDIECAGKLTIIGSVAGNSKASEVFVSTPRMEGNVDSNGPVKISVGTIVVGDVKGTSSVIAGAVKGEIDVNGPVIIDSTAIVKGNINAKSIQINNGAVVDGYCSLCYSDVDIEDFFEE